MHNEDERDERMYNIVVNHEMQYSIWFEDRELPLGWSVVDIPAQWLEDYRKDNGELKGNKEECLAYIKVIWTDMRPLSLQKQMAEQMN